MWRLLRLFYTKQEVEFLEKVYDSFWLFLKFKTGLKKHTLNILLDSSPSFVSFDKSSGEWCRYLEILPCNIYRVFLPQGKEDVLIFVYPDKDESKTQKGFFHSMKEVLHKTWAVPHGMFDRLSDTEKQFNAVNRRPFKSIVITDGDDIDGYKALKGNYVFLSAYPLNDKTKNFHDYTKHAISY